MSNSAADILKPDAVRTAVRLLWLSLAAALFGICAWLYLSPFPVHIGLTLTLSRFFLGFIVSALLIHGIATRKNWARIIFVVFLAYGVLMTVLNVILEAGRFPYLIALDVTLVIVQLYAAYLLFTRASNTWFRPPSPAV